MWMTLGKMVLGLVAVALVCACGESGPPEDFPENVGYLRATHATFGKLIVFDADTFEIYRTVDLPPALEGDSYRLERDDKGRIWIGYSQEYTGRLPWTLKEEILIFSPEGELEHVVKVNEDAECGPPEGGIAFAKGYAFIGCVWSGFYAKVIVVDTNTMDIVKTLDVKHSRPESPEFLDFFIRTVEEVAGSILVIGSGRPSAGYDALTQSQSGVAIVARIDPDTLNVSAKPESTEGVGRA